MQQARTWTYLIRSCMSGPGYRISIVLECPGTENVFKQSTKSPKLNPNRGRPWAVYSYLIKSYKWISRFQHYSPLTQKKKYPNSLFNTKKEGKKTNTLQKNKQGVSSLERVWALLSCSFGGLPLSSFCWFFF